MLPTKGRLCERPLETRAKTFQKSFTKRWRSHSEVGGRHNLAGCVFFAYLRCRKKSEVCSRDLAGCRRCAIKHKGFSAVRWRKNTLTTVARRQKNSVCGRNSFDKTFIKSFCAGMLRVLAQAPLTRGVGQTAPQTSRLHLYQG